MDYKAELDRISNDPKFAQLDYKAQTEVRNAIFKEALKSDPTLQSAKPVDLENIYKYSVFAPPVLQDKQMQSTISTFMRNLDTKPTPETQELYKQFYTNMGLSNGSVAGSFYKIANQLGNALGANADAPLNQLSAIIGSGDESKVWQYLNARDTLFSGTSLDTGTKTLLDVANIGMDIAGFGGAILGASKVVGAGVSAATRGTTKGINSVADLIRTSPKVQQAILNSKNYAQQVALRVALPEAIESVVIGGPVSIALSQLQSTINKTPETSPFSSPEAFIGNYALGTAMDVGAGLLMRQLLPAIGQGMKQVFAKSTANIDLPKGQISQEQLAKSIQDYSEGRYLSKEMAAFAIPYQRDLQEHAQNLTAIANKPNTALTDQERLILGSHLAAPDLFVVPRQNDSYTIWRKADGKSAPSAMAKEEASNIMEVHDIVARHLENNPTRLSQLMDDPKLANAVQTHAPWIYTWNNSARKPSQNIEDTVLKDTSAKGRVAIGSRPYVGFNELTNAKGTVIPVNMKLTKDAMARIRNKDQPFTYNDLSPQTVNADTANAVILADAIKEINMSDFSVNPNAAIIAARKEGFDTLHLKNETDESMGYLPLSPNNVKLTVPNVDLATGLPLERALKRNLTKAPTKEGLTANIYKAMQQTNTFKELADNPQLLTKWAAATFRGNLSPADLTLFAKALTSNDQLPLKINFSNTKNALSDGKSLKLETKDGSIELTVPRQLLDVQASRRFIGDLVAELSYLAGTSFNKGTGASANRIMEILSKISSKTPEDSPIFKILQDGSASGKMISREWLGNILQKELTTTLNQVDDTTFAVRLNNQEIRGSLADIYRAVTKYLVPKKAVADELASNGIRLKQVGDTYVTIEANGAKQVFSSLTEVMDAHSLSTNILPAKYRPTIVEYNPDSNDVQVINEQGQLALSKKQALELLNSFAREEPIRETLIVRTKEGNVAVNTTDSAIELIDNATNSKLYFATQKEATDFAKNDLGSYEGLSTIAASKGVAINYKNGKYMLLPRERGAPVYSATSLEQVKQVLASYPTKNLDATDLLPDADAVLKQMPADLVRKWKSFRNDFEITGRTNETVFDDFTPATTNKLTTGWATTMSTFRAAFGKLVKEKLVAPVLQERTRDLINASKGLMADLQKGRKIVYDLFTVNGKVIPSKRRNAITMHLGAQTEQELALAFKNFPLSADEQTVLKNLRTLMGEQTVTGNTGLAGRFSIPFNRFVNNYSHRLRNLIDSDPNVAHALRASRTSQEFIDYLENGGHIPDAIKDMRLTFEYARSSDIGDIAFEKDAMKIAMRYLHSGLTKLHMDIPSQAFTESYNALKAASKVPEPVDKLLSRFHNSITGIDKDTAGIVRAREFGTALHKVIGNTLYYATFKQFPYLKSNEFRRSGEKILENFMTLQYINLLGARPMTAIRNVAQVYTMLGPAIGMDYLGQMHRWFGNATDAQKAAIVTRMKAGNVINNTPTYMDEPDISSFLGKAAAFTLKWFKNADEFTRFLGYTSATQRFADAVEKLNRGVFGEGDAAKQAFINFSRLSLFQKTDPLLLDDVWSRVSNSSSRQFNQNTMSFDTDELNAAAHLFSDRMVELTLFNYSTWNKPSIVQRGVIGKVAGQLGMFASSYRNYISTVIGNLEPAEKLTFTAAFIGTNLAFYSAFQLMGIRTNDFVPFLPGISGIGPTFETLYDVVQATDPGYGGDQARRNTTERFSPVIWKAKTSESLEAVEGSGFTPAQTQGGRLALNYPALLPGSIQNFYFTKAADYLNKGDYWRTFLTLTTASTDADWQDDLTLSAFGQKLSIPKVTPSYVARTLSQKLMESRQPNPPSMLTP